MLPADLFPTAGCEPPPPRAMLACATLSHEPLISRIVKTRIILRMASFLSSNNLFLPIYSSLNMQSAAWRIGCIGVLA